MNNDFNNTINNIQAINEKNVFKINQLKLEHFYWNFDNIDIGAPITTSIELTCYYNYETEKLEWKKTISHTYLSLENCTKHTTDTYDEKIENPDELIKAIELYDLRDLKNNYFTEKEPENFSHWELTYNTYFKIVGTYDQIIIEFEKISRLLQFKEIIKQETQKIRKKLETI